MHVQAHTVHSHTPTLTVIEPRGLAVRSVGYCRSAIAEAADERINRTVYDSAGRAIAQWDPRLLTDASAPANLTTTYSLSGKALSTISVDAGWRVSLLGEADQPVQGWASRGGRRWTDYDNQLRPLAVFEQAVDGEPRCMERLGYGGADPAFAAHNQCGQLIRHDDSAGTQLFAAFGLVGGVLEQTRHFLRELDSPNWPELAADRDKLLEPGAGATTRSRFNPQGEALEQIDAQGHRQFFRQTVAGQLREVRLQLKNDLAPNTLVSAIQYNAHGQTERETAGNGVLTTLEYAAEDGRLSRLQAKRGTDTLQNLRYAYDPVGNVLSIEDAALPIRYFANQRMEPINRYRYDSLYQLIEATGWEAGSANQGPSSSATADPGVVGNYRQTYRYDAGNNLLELTHVGPQNPGHRMVAAAHSNRCLPVRNGVELGEDDFRNGFDANGNLLNLQAGQALSWDLRNQLQEVRPVERDSGLDDSERYFYGADGMRVRKVRSMQTSARTLTSEVRYLPNLELRSHSGTGEVFQVISAQVGRSSVRVLHWEAGRPAEIANDQQRYSVTDHLGSSAVELDQDAKTISQERYYPFGGTAWADGEAVQVSYKTVRYSGKERDATGLYYYGFRYYVAWLQRWLNPDPAGKIDGMNVYRFVRNSPLTWVDDDGREPKKFRGEANDRIERELAKSEMNSKILARGLSELGAQGVQQKKMMEKVRHAQHLSVEILESAITAISVQPRSQVSNAFIKGLLGGVDVSDSIAKSIEQGLNKILASQRSRLEDGNDQLVIYECNSNASRGESAFVVPTDEHRRIFIRKDAVESSDVSGLAHLLIHEESHLRLKTMDIYYTFSSIFGFPASDKEMMVSLKPSMVASINIARLGEKSSYLEDDGFPFKVAKIGLEEREGSAPMEKIILKNADTWPVLAFALGGHQITSRYAHTKGC
ncbi:hypothetical protein BK659_05525 [Pseudomonas brassicacearum]|uniref:RHS repeat protein n=1 Tax=Pseudomonas brassicacearum TaxID=930166 RepID=A0A423HAM4_9PSED|nr:RHS repeat-associated core domain-containing protein [Pseudomonas brassicacearum]RON10206.1 hypothetical protein BK659_05525 [Pseudomonas brassicacearum]